MSLTKCECLTLYCTWLAATLFLRKCCCECLRDIRGIKYSKQYGHLSHKEKKDLLKSDEAHRLVDELKGRDGIKPSDVKYIRPLSTEMKQLVETLYNAANNVHS